MQAGATPRNMRCQTNHTNRRIPPAVFTFVRNPWARAISAWKHINNRGVLPQCQWGFERFAALPSGYGAMCMGK